MQGRPHHTLDALPVLRRGVSQVHTLCCTYLPGLLNTVADALSHDALPSFHTQMQGADLLPYALMPRLIDALLRNDLDWLSPSWMAHFDSITCKE